MREIKFRAWDSTLRRYIYSYFIMHSSADLMKPYAGGAILEQYTGIKDKHGKDDYESDIVAVYIGGFLYKRKIFQEYSGAWCIKLPVQNSTDEESIMLYSLEHENVGNIHENPELLK